MSHYDIIPDIHGHSDKLSALLAELGYERRGGHWRHDNPTRQIVFLGDFIDRGPDSRGVLETVRDLIADGRALAVMGNHELNAIHFHNDDPETDRPLRPHTAKNEEQHGEFLAQFPPGSEAAREWTDWMAGLPLWLDLGPFRVVHACWDRETIRQLARTAPGGVLPRDRLLAAGRRGTDLNRWVETLTKGPEEPLPDGVSFIDKGDHRRHHVRIAWWRSGARTWREAAISVPDPSALPDEPLPDAIATEIYPAGEKPVFFGHYWLEGDPRIDAANAVCLDYSAGIGENPLIAYAWHPELPGLVEEAIVGRRRTVSRDREEIREKAETMRRACETLGVIAVKRWDDSADGPADDPEFAVAVGSPARDRPVTVYARSESDSFLPMPDEARELGRFANWTEAAAAGWMAD